MLIWKFCFVTSNYPQLFSLLHCQSGVGRNCPMCRRPFGGTKLKPRLIQVATYSPFYYLCTYVRFISFHGPKCQSQFSQLISIRSQAVLCLLSGSTELSQSNQFSNYSNDKIFLLLVILVKSHICLQCFCTWGF